MSEPNYFNFSNVTREQKKRIARMQDAQSEFVFKLHQNATYCPYTIQAIKYLQLAVNCCNAAIIFNKPPYE